MQAWQIFRTISRLDTILKEKCATSLKMSNDKLYMILRRKWILAFMERLLQLLKNDSRLIEQWLMGMLLFEILNDEGTEYRPLYRRNILLQYALLCACIFVTRSHHLCLNFDLCNTYFQNNLGIILLTIFQSTWFHLIVLRASWSFTCFPLWCLPYLPFCWILNSACWCIGMLLLISF